MTAASMSAPVTAPFRFSIEHSDVATAARTGLWLTPHGSVETPAFMPVGTVGSVKGLTTDQLADAGVQMMLANTYHLALSSGAENIAVLGGVQRYSGCDGHYI